jgi:hypothetical protein
MNETRARRIRATNQIPVVRTLKPPPEIWELVPVNEFKAVDSSAIRSASGWRSPILLAVVAGLIGAAGLYLWKIGSTQNVAKAPPSQQAPAKQTTSTSSEISDTTNAPQTSPAPAQISAAPASESSATQPTEVNAKIALSPTASLSGLGLRKKAVKKADTSAAAVTADKPADSTSPVADKAAETGKGAQTTVTDQPAITQPAAGEKSEKPTKIIDSDKKGATDPAVAKPKSNTTLTAQPNAEPKNSPTPKPKVIQWP